MRALHHVQAHTLSPSAHASRKKESLRRLYRNLTFSKLPPMMGVGFRPIQSSRMVA